MKTSLTLPDKPLVSIVMIAWNVEKYIAEAIESVLSQEVDFAYELIIGEDCSTDATRRIATEYEKKFPDRIRVLRHKSNLGLTPNCIATHNACRGKYIALLDSDDYWTDKRKLQIQVDFLEANPEYAGSGHQAQKIYEDNNKKPSPFGLDVDTSYLLDDMLHHRKFHTSSFVYRRAIWERSGGIPPNISSNERAIYPMVAIFGPIKYFGRSMCVYRNTGNGLTSRVDYRELESDFNMLPWLKSIDPDFPVRKFRSFLHLCNYTYGTKRPPHSIMIKHYWGCIVNSFSYFPRNLGEIKWATIFYFRAIRG